MYDISRRCLFLRLYCVGGTKINEHPALVEYSLQDRTKVLGEKPVPERLCKPKYLVDWPGIEPDSTVKWSGTDSLNHETTSRLKHCVV